jgi:hypothetical protein
MGDEGLDKVDGVEAKEVLVRQLRAAVAVIASISTWTRSTATR